MQRRPTNSNTGVQAEVASAKFQFTKLFKKGLYKFLPQVAVVDVVGVLQTSTVSRALSAWSRRCSGGAGVDDIDRPIGLLTNQVQPEPEITHSRLHKRCLEGGVAAPFGVDGRCQGTRAFAAASRFHAVQRRCGSRSAPHCCRCHH